MTEPDAKTFGAWTVVGFCDARTCKCALYRCVCGVVREVGVDALQSGQSVGCGCRQTPKAESSERARRLPDWRPQR